MPKELYLDNASTSQIYTEVIKEIVRINKQNYGNSSSIHNLGERASKELSLAREKIAKEINSKPEEIIFTSGGTESDNLAILGVAKANITGKRKKIFISSVEHSAVYEPAMQLKKEGFEVIEIPVNHEGLVDMEFIRENIDDKTLLVSVIHVNNEIGTINDIGLIGKICRAKGVIFHTDCVQSFGKIDIDVVKMNIDLVSASAHKIGGEKGVGFLFVRKEIKISPIIFGGGQERGLRSGTENVSGIAGMVKALEITNKLDKTKIEKSRNKLIERLEKLGGKINGDKLNRIYNNINISFKNIEGDSLVIFLSKRGIICSTGSACSSRKEEDNRVLKAINVPKEYINGTIRISLNRELKSLEIERIIREIEDCLRILRVKTYK